MSKTKIKDYIQQLENENKRLKNELTDLEKLYDFAIDAWNREIDRKIPDGVQYHESS
jgi:hypothetical protein